ncbi:Rho guanine nucleotide exchange factor 11 [Saguinus oedipus]|uniref:Rho guanine nucleotide exchange factor 11 n=1 Tax=Saguinus oedipus TaxID=9490 RepID=A0ABQ9TI84_SAGOE|nr:Rho guanine nucleotide exchange factor 11 [Saguinus oedipus]
MALMSEIHFFLSETFWQLSSTPGISSCSLLTLDSWCEAMKKLREEGPIIKEISDLMLARFDGPAREELQQVAAQFCSYQSIALELIKTKQRKESRFQLFMQEAESHPQCRRLQLRDLIISEMQRLTKYPLLLESIIKHTEGGTSEHEKLCRARDQCREILKYVNEAVKQTENRHRLEGYQKRLDATALERASHPLAAEFKMDKADSPTQERLDAGTQPEKAGDGVELEVKWRSSGRERSWRHGQEKQSVVFLGL